MKVCLVGGVSSTTQVAAYRAAGWQLWGMNAVLGAFDEHPEHAAAWFQIHPPWSCDARERAWAERCPVLLWAIQRYSEWPTSVSYPLEAVLTLPGAKAAGFASTMAYAVALAIFIGAEAIALPGVVLQMGTVRERTIERANLAWWCGVAEARGIDMEYEDGGHPARVPGGWLYGWDYTDERDAVGAWCEELLGVQRIDGP